MLPRFADREHALTRWREARSRAETLRAAAEKASEQWLEHQQRFLNGITAYHLAKANFKLEPKEFGLRENATSPHEQETAARSVMEESASDSATQLRQSDPFIIALGERVKIALAIVREHQPAAANEVTELARLLAAVGAEMPRAHEIAAKLRPFTLLAQNRGNHSQPAEVDRAAGEIATDLQHLTSGIQERLKHFTYPFPHARGQMSVSEYARSDKPSDNDLQRTYLESDAHVERLFALHYRLTGKLLAHVSAAEKVIGPPAH